LVAVEVLTLSQLAEGNTAGGAFASRRRASRGQEPVHARNLHVENREIPRSPARLDGGAGRRVELRVSQAEVMATVLDAGELAARHRRSFAGGLTFTGARSDGLKATIAATASPHGLGLATTIALPSAHPEGASSQPAGWSTFQPA
jgi:hypothetical protein